MPNAVTTSALSAEELAVDRELADIDASFRFLLNLTPVDLVESRRRFHRSGRAPNFRYRPVSDDVDVARQRLDQLDVQAVEHPTVASLLLAKARELRLQLEMLSCRESDEFLGLSMELYGSVGPALLDEAAEILATVPIPEPESGPWLDAHEFADAAQQELDHYRNVVPDLEAHVEIRDGSTGVMVSNGDVLVAPTARVSVCRLDALLQHEIGTHVLTHVNGAHQPLRTLAGGLAGHEETQEGLAVLAEYLVGGLSADRLRQLAARVVAVHQMVEGAAFPDVHQGLIEAGVPKQQAFTIAMRVFRSGGLTKDAIYLEGLRDLVAHIAGGGTLDVFWLGKLPLTAAPLVEQLWHQGVLIDPVLRPRYLDDAAGQSRVRGLGEIRSLTQLLGGAA